MLFTPLPLSQTVTLSRTPSPLERDVGLLYGRPLRQRGSLWWMTNFKLVSINFRTKSYLLATEQKEQTPEEEF